MLSWRHPFFLNQFQKVWGYTDLRARRLAPSCSVLPGLSARLEELVHALRQGDDLPLPVRLEALWKRLILYTGSHVLWTEETSP